MVKFLCRIPNHHALAMAIHIVSSVTVSIGEDMMGSIKERSGCSSEEISRSKRAHWE